MRVLLIVSFKQRSGVTVGLPLAGEDFGREQLVAKEARHCFKVCLSFLRTSGAHFWGQILAPNLVPN